jgi:hypothetical protein
MKNLFFSLWSDGRENVNFRGKKIEGWFGVMGLEELG